jgi:vitamin B12 transporter
MIKKVLSCWREHIYAFSIIIAGWIFLSGNIVLAADIMEEEQILLSLYYEPEDLNVFSSARRTQPLTEVAENVTVIDAQTIREMNAHSVADILNRVPGLFVNFNHEFGASSLISIQGSQQRHVLTMLDGMAWNNLIEGVADTRPIPVGIIDRIEIIKGPASSAWGSALGGIVNIITKSAGRTGTNPKGTLQAAWGEHHTIDGQAQIVGTAGKADYYFYAGYQSSNGLESSRYFDMPHVYSKIRLPLWDTADFKMTFGYSDVATNLGNFSKRNLSSTADLHSCIGTASLETNLTSNLHMTTSCHIFKQGFDLHLDPMMNDTESSLFSQTDTDREKIGVVAQWLWRCGRQTLTWGVEREQGEVEQLYRTGTMLQQWGIPPETLTDMEITRWAVFLNDTIPWGRYTLTFGIRYDDNDISGDFISPSLGLTRRVGENSLLRLSVARGFTIPPLTATSGGDFFLAPNSDLDPEEIWSWQMGFETTGLRYCWLKGTLFYHQLNDALVREYRGGGPPAYNDQYFNSGEEERKGLEFEVETIAFHGVSLSMGGSVVDISPEKEEGSETMYTCQAGIRYEDQNVWRAELFGHYIWWDYDPSYESENDIVLWDFNCSRKIYKTKTMCTELFFSVHNLFDGAQYLLVDNENPGRWIEAGIRLDF